MCAGSAIYFVSQRRTEMEIKNIKKMCSGINTLKKAHTVLRSKNYNFKVISSDQMPRISLCEMVEKSSSIAQHYLPPLTASHVGHTEIIYI